MDSMNYILDTLSSYKANMRTINKSFRDIEFDINKAFKLIKRVDRTNTVLLLGGVGLLYLISKLSSKVMALEAAVNQTETEEAKGE